MSQLKALLRRGADLHLELGPGRKIVPAGAPAVAGRTRHVAILTPSTVGNLGDEAMVSSVVSQLRAIDPKLEITLITHEPTDAPYYHHLKVHTVHISGYFARVANGGACARLGELMTKATDFIMLGADVIDGRYNESRSFRRLYMARQAHQAGLNVFVLGFSFSDKATLRIRAYMSKECTGFTYVCRDPLSAQRVSDIVGKPVGQGADLAFMVPIPDDPMTDAATEANVQIDAWRTEDRPVVVFNANPLGLMAAMPDIDLSAAAQAYATCIDAVSKRTGCAVLMLTHDNRPGPHSDADFMTQVREKMDATVPCHFEPRTMRAMDVKMLCRRVDLTVTGRMHLGIASLGAGTATMILDFQGKVQGLFRLFGMPEMALNVEDVLEPEVFSNLVTEKLADHANIAQRVQGNLDKIHELSRVNVASVTGAWKN
jgi:polysaccharide pyruvyl transferase WcaK-like protein